MTSDRAKDPLGWGIPVRQNREVGIGDVVFGGDHPLGVIAGPCVLEDADAALRVAQALKRITSSLGLPFVFKSSFDKANRSSWRSYRGPGLKEGLAILAHIRQEAGVPVTTDVHEPGQAEAVADVVDLLQIPAFLCRQTDLLTACARTGKPVSVKKGQFLSPSEVHGVLGKLQAGGARAALFIERGSSFGYHDLVVDMRSIELMRQTGWPVVFDGTHSVQQPGARGDRSGGLKRFIPVLVRAAVAAGADAVFLEVHEDPDHALCDGPNMVPLSQVSPLLNAAKALHALVHGLEAPTGKDPLASP